MRKGNFFAQTLDILTKIFSSFILVFLLYFISEKVNYFAYNYFIFPTVIIIIIFVCGLNVGRSLEKIKRNEEIGFFTKRKKNVKEESYEPTEFIVKDTTRIVTNKKILKEVEDGNQIHIKVMNYNDVVDEERE